MYAVVRTGGRQYRVEEGRAIKLARLAGEPGDTIELGDVLILGEGDDVTVGTPAIAGARVLGEITEQGRERKTVVFRYKAKTRSRKKTGHRQRFTKVIVRDILAPGQEPRPREAKPEPEPAVAEEAPKRRRRRKAEADTAPAVETPVAETALGTPTAPEADVAPAKPKRRSRKAE